MSDTDRQKAALQELVKWHGKRGDDDELLPAHQQEPEIAFAMEVLDGDIDSYGRVLFSALRADLVEQAYDSGYMEAMQDAYRLAKIFGSHDFAEHLIEQVNERSHRTGLPEMKVSK